MKKKFKILLFIGAIVFALQFTVSPLIHNHKPDLKDHYNCPAYILNTTFVSFAFVFFLSFVSKFPKRRYKLFTSEILYVSHSNYLKLNNRAPPF